MNRHRMSWLSIAFTFALASGAYGGEINITNRTDSRIILWIWSGEERDWVNYIAMTPKQQIIYPFRNRGSYYLVARKGRSKANDMILGWYNFEALKSRPDFDAINIDSKTFKEEITQTYTICKPVWESRTRTRQVYCWTLIDGCWQLVPTTIVENYKICKVVPEQRTRTMTVKRLGFAGGAWSKTAQLKCKLTVNTLEKGAFVRCQLTARNEVLPLDNPTSTTQIIPVGDYFIWTVRGEKETSKRFDSFPVWEANKDITIQELVPQSGG